MNTNKNTLARALAMQMLYQLELNAETFETFVGEFLLRSEENDGEVKAISRSLAVGANLDRTRIDRLISEAAEKWELKRIAPVDRAILRLGVHELLNVPATPPKVAINEAIELAKAYSTVESPGFVNGILDAILKRPDFEAYRHKQELPEELQETAASVTMEQMTGDQ